MKNIFVIAFSSFVLIQTMCGTENTQAEGYRGIWYSIGQDSGHGPKYSGGLGSYPANMVPMVLHDPQSEQTFFVYGGTSDKSRKDLQIMVGTFDHKKGALRRPTTVRDSDGFKDAHANPSLGMDKDGFLFVFSATRHSFQGRIHESQAMALCIVGGSRCSS